MALSPETLPILRFWRDVEIFNLPSSPTYKDRKGNVKVSFLKDCQALPWSVTNPRALRSTDKYSWYHTVYLGVAQAQDWARLILEAAISRDTLSQGDIEKISGQSWAAAFEVDEYGRPIANSLVPASFVLGMARLLDNKNLDGLNSDIEAAKRAFDERRVAVATGDMTPDEETLDAGQLDADLETLGSGIDWPVLREEVAHAVQALGDLTHGLEFSVIVKSRQRFRKTNSEKDGEGTDFLNSFFLDDLDRLIDEQERGRGFGKALSGFLGKETPLEVRQDVLQDHASMAACVSPAHMPTGRWPANPAHHLMLAQQAAVFEIISQLSDAEGLVAVNGPPGTGKTTLLCDVIADVVVQRAARLAKLKSPWALFSEHIFINGMKVSPIRPEIVADTGIVVASNNNTAVENITRELPARNKIATDSFPHAGYFSEVAANVFKQTEIEEPAWGLVAAALGNRGNRSAFAQAFFDKDGTAESYRLGQACDIKSLLEAALKYEERSNLLQNWHQAKQEFLQLLSDFKEEQARCCRWQQALDSIEEAEKELQVISDKLAGLEVERTERESVWQSDIEEKEHSLALAASAFETADAGLRQAKLAAQAASDRLRSVQARKPVFWKYWLHRLGIEKQQVRSWLVEVSQALEQRAAKAEAQGEATAARERQQAAQQKANQDLHALRKEQAFKRTSLQHEIARIEARRHELYDIQDQARSQLSAAKGSGISLPDSMLFAQPSNDLHLTSVWVSRNLDELRGNLFLSALRLHEVTLRACAGKAIGNLRAVRAMLTGDLIEPLTANERTVLWNMLFFLVPVVSSTLASFHRLFEGMGRASIGWLLIDEGGQATPQSVAGALWRARRAVIIGDPQQIEPVVTVPDAIIAEFRKRHNVASCWSPGLQSAQTVADRSMTKGASIGKGGDQESGIWTGMPLRAHRRCTDPMFTVANRIAYGNQMVQANLEPPAVDCILGDSAWFDVQGQGADGQVVEEEISVLGRILLGLRQAWPTVQGKRASIYVISPFRKVNNACWKVVDGAGLSPSEDYPIKCGTVHTFQGKEADIVFLVLGSAPGDTGRGSRDWASKKPNLLNVALTRAKLRVYVLGNVSDWEAHSGFDELVQELREQNRIITVPQDDIASAWVAGYL